MPRQNILNKGRGIADDDGVLRIDVAEIANLSEHQKFAYKYVGKKARIFAGGARGGGKSHLVIAVAVLACLMFPGLRVCVIRKSMDELRQQLIDNLLLKLWRPDELFQWRRSEKTAYFDNGSVIYFRSLEHAEDVGKVLGVEFGLVIIDEANQLNESIIIKVIGSIRSFDIPGWKPTLFCTGNPGGLSDRYFKDYWVEPRYDRWSEEEQKLKDEYVFIPFGVNDNPHATEEYKESLRALPETLRRAWLDGDWNAIQGAFFEMWNPAVHVVKPFEIPSHWVRFRAVDLGYGKHPSVCLFAAQDPADGTVYVYDEVSTKDTTDVFIEMIQRASGDAEFAVTFFDPNSMRSRRGETADALSPAVMFEMEGIYVRPAINERMNGWLNVKSWMRYHDEGDDFRDKDGNLVVMPPKLKVFDNCFGLIETIPIQQYVENKADLNTRGQDDFVDALRYLLSHIPYGYYLDQDGQAYEKEGEQKQNRGFGVDEERYADLPKNKNVRAEDRLYERDGVVGSIYSMF